MSGLILDSSIVIAGERRGQTVRQILEQIRVDYGELDIGLSVVTIAELMHGAYRGRSEEDKMHRRAFIEHLANDVPVYPLTLSMARMVGRIEGEQAALGVAVAFQDLAIGVTALTLGFNVATLNVRHFLLIPGLEVAGIC